MCLLIEWQNKLQNFTTLMTSKGHKKIIYDVAQFLNQPTKEFTHFFDLFVIVSMNDYAVTLADKKLEILSEHVTSLEGIWQPTQEESSQYFLDAINIAKLKIDS